MYCSPFCRKSQQHFQGLEAAKKVSHPIFRRNLCTQGIKESFKLHRTQTSYSAPLKLYENKFDAGTASKCPVGQQLPQDHSRLRSNARTRPVQHTPPPDALSSANFITESQSVMWKAYRMERPPEGNWKNTQDTPTNHTPPQPYNTAWFQPCHYSSRDHHSWIGAKPLILTKPYQAHLANTKTFMKTLNSSHPYKMSLKTLRQALLKTLIPLKITNTFWHLHPLIYQDWTSDITTY